MSKYDVEDMIQYFIVDRECFGYTEDDLDIILHTNNTGQWLHLAQDITERIW